MKLIAQGKRAPFRAILPPNPTYYKRLYHQAHFAALAAIFLIFES